MTRARALLAILLGALGTAAMADDKGLEQVVVTAKKRPEPPPSDAQVTERVETALSDDPYIYAEHITVTTRNGVVKLEGIVGDPIELFRMIRLTRKIPGARRVVTDVQIQSSFPD